MSRRSVGLCLAGLGTVALVAGGLLSLPPATTPRAQLLPDVGGPISMAAATASSARRSALRSGGLVTELGRVLPERIALLLLTNDRDAFSLQGETSRDVRFVELSAAAALTIWPQDPFLVLELETGEPALLASRDFERASDREMAQALHEALGWQLLQSSLHFEGGNLVSDASTIFVGADTIARNVADLGLPAEEVVLRLEESLGRRVLVLGPSPQPVPHIDLAVTPLGNGRVLVADGAWGARLAEQALVETPQAVADFERRASAGFFGHPKIGALTLRDGSTLEPPVLEAGTAEAVANARRVAHDLDGLARGLEERGFRVDRIPLLLPALSREAPAGPGYPVLTYNNVLMERESGRDRVYLPRYGLAALDEAATEVWRGLGFEVVPVDGLVTSAMYGGSLRCGLKVLARSG